MTRLLDRVPGVEPEAVTELAAAEVRRLPAGSTHGCEAFRDASFLIVENGFVVIRRAFSGRRGVAQGQDVTYITERCVMKLSPEGLVVTEIAPGVDLKAHVLDQADIPLKIAPQLKVMDDALFHPQAMGAKCHA